LFWLFFNKEQSLFEFYPIGLEFISFVKRKKSISYLGAMKKALYLHLQLRR